MGEDSGKGEVGPPTKEGVVAGEGRLPTLPCQNRSWLVSLMFCGREKRRRGEEGEEALGEEKLVRDGTDFVELVVV